MTGKGLFLFSLLSFLSVHSMRIDRIQLQVDSKSYDDECLFNHPVNGLVVKNEAYCKSSLCCYALGKLSPSNAKYQAATRTFIKKNRDHALDGARRAIGVYEPFQAGCDVQRLNWRCTDQVFGLGTIPGQPLTPGYWQYANANTMLSQERLNAAINGQSNGLSYILYANDNNNLIRLLGFTVTGNYPTITQANYVAYVIDLLTVCRGSLRWTCLEVRNLVCLMTNQRISFIGTAGVIVHDKTADHSFDQICAAFTNHLNGQTTLIVNAINHGRTQNTPIPQIKIQMQGWAPFTELFQTYYDDWYKFNQLICVNIKTEILHMNVLLEASLLRYVAAIRTALGDHIDITCDLELLV